MIETALFVLILYVLICLLFTVVTIGGYLFWIGRTAHKLIQRHTNTTKNS